MPRLTLISHTLCPYVQRAAIALTERNVPFERVYIDLADKPGWFSAMSPLGKVPLLLVQADGQPDVVLFESAAIVEYLEDTLETPLHPADPLERARHRGWMEFGSEILNGIGRLYSAKTDASLGEAAARLAAMFGQIEAELGDGPYFAGSGFSLVDAAFGPVFRYFDTFDRIEDFAIFTDLHKTRKWRAALSARPSVRNAVQPDYPQNLMNFLRRRNSEISRHIPDLAA